MNKKEIFEIFDAITTSGQCAFVNDFSGWGSNAEIPGYKFISAIEGNGVVSEATGKDYVPQCQSIRRGNHLEAQLRQDGEVMKRITLGSLFPNHDIVIVTDGESLRLFAPVLTYRSDVINWLVFIHEYCTQRRKDGNPEPWFWEGHMAELAKFFFRNNPKKVENRSIYDELTDV